MGLNYGKKLYYKLVLKWHKVQQKVHSMIIVEVKGRSWSLCTFALQLLIQYSLTTPRIESLCYSNILVRSLS